MTAGVLVVDKPAGPTSHDIVAVARRALRERRIGHCGTLDPMATGVLVLAVGAATRLVRFIAAEEKRYDALIRFGRVTTTFDAAGTVISEALARPTLEAVVAALERFRGEFLQVPPAYSAKKVDGERAYDLARRAGDKPALEPARVALHDVELISFDGEVARVAMRVSAGFYVRSLAHDLGQALGMGAVLDALRRTQAGPFGLDQALAVDEIVTTDAGRLARRLIPMEQLLPEVPGVALSADEAARARRGLDVSVPPEWSGDSPLARLLDDRGRLVGIAQPGGRAGLLHPFVVLN